MKNFFALLFSFALALSAWAAEPVIPWRNVSKTGAVAGDVGAPSLTTGGTFLSGATATFNVGSTLTINGTLNGTHAQNLGTGDSPAFAAISAGAAGVNSSTRMKVYNNAAVSGYYLGDSSSSSQDYASFTYNGATGEAVLENPRAYPLIFKINGAEAGRFTTSGNFSASGTGTHTFSGGLSIPANKVLSLGTTFAQRDGVGTTYIYSGGGGGIIFRNAADTSIIASLNTGGDFSIPGTLTAGTVVAGSSVFTTSTPDTAVNIISTATAGRSYAIAAAGSGSGNIPGAGFYIYDSTGSAIRFSINPSGLVKSHGGLSVGTTGDYADNAAAVTAGLAVGTVYRTGDLLKIVH